MISMATYNFARGQGVEPRLPGPKPGVLPLDDPRMIKIKPYVFACHSDQSDPKAIAEGKRSGGICKYKILAFNRDTFKIHLIRLQIPRLSRVLGIARDDKFKCESSKN